MEGLSNTVPIGVLLRDRDGGEVRVGRDGEPVVRYKLSEFDAAHLRTGIDGAAQISRPRARGGSSPRTRSGSAYEPGRPAAASSSWPTPTPPATAPASARSARSTSWARPGWAARRPPRPAIPTGQTWDVRDLYVLDGSSFPTASGVNPQISIQAIAHMSARGLAAKLS